LKYIFDINNIIYHENNIELLENYTNVKINRDYYVRGICKTKIETCVENILEEDILTNRRDVPEIWYRDKSDKLRRHLY
jgi:hypothetical protein